MKPKKAMSPIMLIIFVLISALITAAVVIAFVSVAYPQAAGKAAEVFFGPLAPQFKSLGETFGLKFEAGVLLQPGEVVFGSGPDLWACNPTACITQEAPGITSGCRRIAKDVVKVTYYGPAGGPIFTEEDTLKITGVGFGDVEGDGVNEIIFTTGPPKSGKSVRGEDPTGIIWKYDLDKKEKQILAKTNSKSVSGIGVGDVIPTFNGTELVYLDTTPPEIGGKFNVGVCIESLQGWYYQQPTLKGSSCTWRNRAGEIPAIDYTGLDVADLDGDGVFNDVVLLLNPTTIEIRDTSNWPQRTLLPISGVESGADLHGLGIGDVDGDGVVDAVIADNTKKFLYKCDLGGVGSTCEPLCFTDKNNMAGVAIVSHESTS